MMLAMFKKRKNQPKAEPKPNPPSSPPNASPNAPPNFPPTSPNALPALPNPQNGLHASPRPQNSTAASTNATNGNDDEIAMFAKQSGIPESIVRIEFQIIQSLYNASHKDIIDRYHTLPVPALLPIVKLRYIRNFWKQLNQSKT